MAKNCNLINLKEFSEKEIDNINDIIFLYSDNEEWKNEIKDTYKNADQIIKAIEDNGGESLPESFVVKSEVAIEKESPIEKNQKTFETKNEDKNSIDFVPSSTTEMTYSMEMGMGKYQELVKEFTKKIIENTIFKYNFNEKTGKITTTSINRDAEVNGSENVNMLNYNIFKYKIELLNIIQDCTKGTEPIPTQEELNSGIFPSLNAFTRLIKRVTSKFWNNLDQYKSNKDAFKAFVILNNFDTLLKNNIDFLSSKYIDGIHDVSQYEYIEPKAPQLNNWNDETSDIRKTTSKLQKILLDYLPVINKKGTKEVVDKNLTISSVSGGFEFVVGHFKNWLFSNTIKTKDDLSKRIREQKNVYKKQFLNRDYSNLYDAFSLYISYVERQGKGSINNHILGIARSIRKFILDKSSNLPLIIKDMFVNQIAKTVKQYYVAYQINKGQSRSIDLQEFLLDSQSLFIQNSFKSQYTKYSVHPELYEDFKKRWNIRYDDKLEKFIIPSSDKGFQRDIILTLSPKKGDYGSISAGASTSGIYQNKFVPRPDLFRDEEGKLNTDAILKDNRAAVSFICELLQIAIYTDAPSQTEELKNLPNYETILKDMYVGQNSVPLLFEKLGQPCLTLMSLLENPDFLTDEDFYDKEKRTDLKSFKFADDFKELNVFLSIQNGANYFTTLKNQEGNRLPANGLQILGAQPKEMIERLKSEKISPLSGKSGDYLFLKNPVWQYLTSGDEIIKQVAIRTDNKVDKDSIKASKKWGVSELAYIEIINDFLGNLFKRDQIKGERSNNQELPKNAGLVYSHFTVTADKTTHYILPVNLQKAIINNESGYEAFRIICKKGPKSNVFVNSVKNKIFNYYNDKYTKQLQNLADNYIAVQDLLNKNFRISEKLNLKKEDSLETKILKIDQYLKTLGEKYSKGTVITKMSDIFSTRGLKFIENIHYSKLSTGRLGLNETLLNKHSIFRDNKDLTKYHNRTAFSLVQTLLQFDKNDLQIPVKYISGILSLMNSNEIQSFINPITGNLNYYELTDENNNTYPLENIDLSNIKSFGFKTNEKNQIDNYTIVFNDGNNNYSLKLNPIIVGYYYFNNLFGNSFKELLLGDGFDHPTKYKPTSKEKESISNIEKLEETKYNLIKKIDSIEEAIRNEKDANLVKKLSSEKQELIKTLELLPSELSDNESIAFSIKNEASRENTGFKRAVPIGATVQPFLFASDTVVFGVNRNLKVACIEDVSGITWNLKGQSERGLDSMDGSGISHPVQAIAENMSLLDANVGMDKKTIFADIDPEFGTQRLLKWAVDAITNSRRRYSWGSEIKLENVYKKMSNIPLTINSNEGNTDALISSYYDPTPGIDLVWDLSGSRPLTYNKFLFYQDTDTGDHYKILSVSNKGNVFTRVVQKVDDFGENIEGEESFKETVKINTLYDLDQFLGGAWAETLQENKLRFTEDNLYILTKFVCANKLQDKYIGYLVNKSAMKVGVSNLNSADKWYNSESFNTFDMSLEFGGAQMDQEHELDFSQVTEMSQMVSALIQNGYCTDLVSEIYTSIGQIAISGVEDIITDLNSGNEEKVYRAIGKALLDSFSLGTGSSMGLAESFVLKASQYLDQKDIKYRIPLSDGQLIDKFFATVVSNVNKSGIKRKYSGIASYLVPSHDIIEYYRYGDRTYLYPELRKITKAKGATVKQALNELQWIDEKTGKVIDNPFIEDTIPNNIEIEDSIVIKKIDGGSESPIMNFSFNKEWMKDGVIKIDSFEKLDYFRNVFSTTDELNNEIYKLCKWTLKPKNLRQADYFFSAKLSDTVSIENMSVYDLDSVRACHYISDYLDNKKNIKLRTYLTSRGLKDGDWLKEKLIELSALNKYSDLKLLLKDLQKQQQKNIIDLQKGVVKWNSTFGKLGIEPINSTFKTFNTRFQAPEIIMGHLHAKELGLDRYTTISEVLDGGVDYFKSKIQSEYALPEQSVISKDSYDLVINNSKGEKVLVIIGDPDSTNKRFVNTDGKLYKSSDKIKSGDVWYKNKTSICQDSKEEISFNKFVSGTGEEFEVITLKSIDKLNEILRSSDYSDKVIYNYSKDNWKDLLYYQYNDIISKDSNGNYTLKDNKPLHISIKTEEGWAELEFISNLNSPSVINDSDEKIKDPKESDIINILQSKSNSEINIAIENLAKLRFLAFKKQLNYIGSRIPTQSMQSFMPMTVVGFTDSETNDIYVPKSQTWLQGSDYDIDKLFILGFSLMRTGELASYSDLSTIYSETGELDSIFDLPIPDGKTYKYVKPTNKRITEILNSCEFKENFETSHDKAFVRPFNEFINYRLYKNPNSNDITISLEPVDSYDTYIEITLDENSELIPEVINNPNDIYFESLAIDPKEKYLIVDKGDSINFKNGQVASLEEILKENNYLNSLNKNTLSIQKTRNFIISNVNLNSLELKNYDLYSHFLNEVSEAFWLGDNIKINYKDDSDIDNHLLKDSYGFNVNTEEGFIGSWTKVDYPNLVTFDYKCERRDDLTDDVRTRRLRNIQTINNILRSGKTEFYLKTDANNTWNALERVYLKLDPIINIKDSIIRTNRYKILIAEWLVKSNQRNIINTFLDLDSQKKLDDIFNIKDKKIRIEAWETFKEKKTSLLWRTLPRNSRNNIKNSVRLSHELNNYSKSFKRINKERREAATRNKVVTGVWKVTTDVANLSNAMNPINMDVQRRAANSSTLSNDESVLTLDSPALKQLMQIANMVGKDVIGISAVMLKNFFGASFFINYRNKEILEDLKQQKFNDVLEKIQTIVFQRNFVFEGYENEICTLSNINFDPIIEYLENNGIETINIDNIVIDDKLPNLNDYFVDSNFRILDFMKHLKEISSNIDAADSISGLLSAATDNAKELILAKINASPEFADIYGYLLMSGVDFETIARFMMSPIMNTLVRFAKHNDFDSLTKNTNVKRAAEFVLGKNDLGDVRKLGLRKIVKLWPWERNKYASSEFLNSSFIPKLVFEINEKGELKKDANNNLIPRKEKFHFNVKGEDFELNEETLYEMFELEKVDGESHLSDKSKELQNAVFELLFNNDAVDILEKHILFLKNEFIKSRGKNKGYLSEFGIEDSENDYENDSSYWENEDSDEQPEDTQDEEYPEDDYEDEEGNLSKRNYEDPIYSNNGIKNIQDYVTLLKYLDFYVKKRNALLDQEFVDSNGKILKVKDQVNLLETLEDTILPAVEELKIMGKIMHSNQGFPTNPWELYNYISSIEHHINDRYDKYNKEHKLTPEDKATINSNPEDLVYLEPFNLKNFINNDIEREKQIKNYNKVKSAINILDSVSTIPNFRNMFNMVALADSLTEQSSKVRLQKALISELVTSNSKKINKEQFKIISRYIDQIYNLNWILNQNISLTLHEGDSYYTSDTSTSMETLTEPGSTKVINLTEETGYKIANNLATFRMWVNNRVIPSLKRDKNLENNRFLMSLSSGYVKNNNRQLMEVFRFPFTPKDISEVSEINNEWKLIVSDFNKIAEDPLNKYGIDSEYSIMDILFLYNLLNFGDGIREASIGKVLEDKNLYVENSFINDHSKWISELDSGLEGIGEDGKKIANLKDLQYNIADLYVALSTTPSAESTFGVVIDSQDEESSVIKITKDEYQDPLEVVSQKAPYSDFTFNLPVQLQWLEGDLPLSVHSVLKDESGKYKETKNLVRYKLNDREVVKTIIDNLKELYPGVTNEVIEFDNSNLESIISNEDGSYSFSPDDKLKDLNVNSKEELESIKEGNAFIYNGKIYVNLSNANIGSAFHEYMHIAAAALKFSEDEKTRIVYYNLLDKAQDLYKSKFPREYKVFMDKYKDVEGSDFQEEILVHLLEKMFTKKIETSWGRDQESLDYVKEVLINAVPNMLNLPSEKPDINMLLSNSLETILRYFNSTLFDFDNNTVGLDNINLTAELRTIKQKLIDLGYIKFKNCK